MSDEESVPLYKIVLAGDLGVGKTSIFRRYDIDKFSDYREPTFGLDKLSKNIEVDGKRLKVMIEDTRKRGRKIVNARVFNLFTREQIA